MVPGGLPAGKAVLGQIEYVLAHLGVCLAAMLFLVKSRPLWIILGLSLQQDSLGINLIGVYAISEPSQREDRF